ncbi:DUF1236 domain-containing protein [Bradyrhizobium ontarionense]|uniref:DUF1236 domain-containing protein n=1 Tax=Bradyrhizobium ontarionense TaxID=2898149 RepID=A0ABY3RCU3_9BRAD|nr:DUF1236 domain-containing protein [Bradyrhizobium sp. A19]UFZ04631.1 DUF1236 domain-containing protein [Bradyrhizobium sp. A19]
MMTKHWLGTAAIILAIGTASGAASAQSEMKHEGGPAAAPREAARPAAEAKGGPAAAERAASETKQGAQEPRRAEPPTAREPVREQAQERSVPEGKQGVEQSKGERGPTSAQRDRDAKDGAENKQADGKNKAQDKPQEKQQGHADERKTDDRAAETSKSGATDRKSDREADRNSADKAGQSRDERGNRASDKTADKPDTDRSKQVTQPNRGDDKSAAQQDPKSGPATGDARKPDATNQAGNQTQPDGKRPGTAVSVNDQQRTRVIDQLRHDRDFDRARTDIDIRINVGERLPERVRPRPLPSDIVTIVPEYRGYEYTVVHDEIAIIDPQSREIVDVIPQNGVRADHGYDRGGYGVSSTRIVLSDDQRQILRRAATETGTVGSTTSSSSSSSGSSCLSLRRVPDELARANPELANYQYLAIGDQVVLIDPRDQKVVQVIDQQQ